MGRDEWLFTLGLWGKVSKKGIWTLLGGRTAKLRFGPPRKEHDCHNHMLARAVATKKLAPTTAMKPRPAFHRCQDKTTGSISVAERWGPRVLVSMVTETRGGWTVPLNGKNQPATVALVLGTWIRVPSESHGKIDYSPQKKYVLHLPESF